MGALIRVSVPICAFLLGCTSTVQVGLANAPLLINGGTPETRVHDVIANGHDSCERSAFPPGEVLRGQIPPCNPTEKVPGVPAFMPTQPPSSARIPPTYPTSMCPSPGPGLSTERSMAGLRLSSQSELACNEPW
jgi:hypothetical protein